MKRIIWKEFDVKRKIRKIMLTALCAGVLLLTGAQVYAAEGNAVTKQEADSGSEQEKTFPNMEKTSFQMGFLRNEKLQQGARVLLLAVLAVIIALCLKIKAMIYKKEREKEDRN